MAANDLSPLCSSTPMTVQNGNTTNGASTNGMSNDARVAPLSIIVVGAGLGGLAAAISCTLAGHEVTVLEQASKLGEVCLCHSASYSYTSPPILNHGPLTARWALASSLPRT